jgi:hypothetical protein
MRLEPLYRARFTATDRWSVELSGAHGTEAQNLLFAEGRCEGQIAGALRASNFPRRRADGVLTPDFRGVVQTDDGATILFTWRGYGITATDGVNRLVGAITHVSDAEHYGWLNTVVCAVAGVVQPRANDAKLDVVLDVSQLVWEPPKL